MKRLIACIGMFAILAGITGALSTRSQAGQDARTNDIKSKLMPGKSRGEGTTVKTESDVNKKGAPRPLSAAKGGTKMRGGEGIVHVDSHMGYYCRIYDNNMYIGTVAPSGDLYYRAEAGGHILYGRVYFSDGTYQSAGPRHTTVGDDETVTWHLYP